MTRETAISKFVSFDVFETVLVRPFATARGIFRLVATDLQAGGLISLGRSEVTEFVRRRLEVDRQIWCETAGRCELRMLYQAIAKNYGWTAEQVEIAAKTELSVEERECRVVPSALARVQAARSEGCRVVFISDTYLRSEELGAILSAKGLFALEDRLYCSADCGLTKSTGGLFARVRGENKGEWIAHFGNDRHSDVAMARRCGVNGVLLDSGNLKLREQIILEEFGRRGLEELGDKLAGASRVARLLAEAESDPKSGARKAVLAGVGAPFFACYALWLFRQMKGRGLARIYFLARDGYLPKQFYDRILAQADRPESSYLHASRAAWHPATLDVEEYYAKWLFDAPEQLTAARVGKRMRLEGELASRFTDLMAQHGLALDAMLDKEGFGRLEAAMKTLEGKEIRRAQAAGQRILVETHLKQSGLTPTQRFSLVDLGWNGRLQHSLSLIRRQPVALGLYAGLKSTASAGKEVGNLTAFLFDERDSGGGLLGSGGLMGNCIQILESFGLAPHGSVTGYRRSENGSVQAAFALGDENGDWTYARLGGVFDDYLGVLRLDEADTEHDPESLRDACAAMLRRFVVAPSSEEAEAWGGYPFVSDQAGGQSFELGQPLPPANVARLASALCGRIPYGPASVWRVAARRRTPRLRVALYFAAAAPAKLLQRAVCLFAPKASVGH